MRFAFQFIIMVEYLNPLNIKSNAFACQMRADRETKGSIFIWNSIILEPFVRVFVSSFRTKLARLFAK